MQEVTTRSNSVSYESTSVGHGGGGGVGWGSYQEYNPRYDPAPVRSWPKLADLSLGDDPFGIEPKSRKKSCKKKIMADVKIIALTAEQEEILGEDDKALVQAGLVGADLAATPEGLKELNRVLFKANRKALADVAREAVAKAKKEQAKRTNKV